MSVYKIIVGVLFLGMMGFTYHTYKTKTQTINVVSDSLEIYKDKYERAVVAQNATSVNESEINQIVKNNDSLKSIVKKLKDRQVSSITRINTIINYDTIQVPLRRDTSAMADSLFNFRYNKNQLTLQGVVNVPKRKVSIGELTVKNRQDILIDRDKDAMSGYRSYRVRIVNSNPYIKVTNIEAYQLDIKKKWYEKWYIVAPAGILVGAIIVKI